MDDDKIVSLYWQRNETAINETQLKYGKYIFSIANGILHSTQDAQECENDTYLALWTSIPPGRPDVLSAFIGKIVRRISINKWKSNTAQKRGGGEIVLALEELDNCVDANNTENTYEQQELTWVLNQFLSSLSETERNVFLCRYWYMDSIKAISEYSGFTQSKITSMLHRTRDKLRKRLSEEGYL